MRSAETYLFSQLGKEAADELHQETLNSGWELHQELVARLGKDFDGGIVVIRAGREKSGFVRSESIGLFMDDEGLFRALKLTEVPGLYSAPHRD